MKSNQNTLLESEIILSTKTQKQQQLLLNVLCSSSNLSIFVCMNKKCNNKAFMCQDQNCTCQKNHSNCLKLQIQSLLNNIMSRKFSTIESLERCINDRVGQLIDQLSDFRDKALKEINENFQFFGLNNKEKDFIKQTNNYQLDKITGHKISQLIATESEQQTLAKKIKQTHQLMQINFQQMNLIFFQAIKRINNQLSQYNLNLSNKVDQIKITQKTYSQDHLFLLKNCFLNTKVIQSQIQVLTLLTFFEPRRIIQAQLLYRASQHNFQVKKFHQKCDGISSTLILVKTQFSKKIGGYTPIKWRHANPCVWMKDYQLSSFLFSLTQGDKFDLMDSNNAIQLDSGYGPIFGDGRDLCIVNNSNKLASYANINCSYQNEKYNMKDKNSWRKFSGNSNSNQFKIKEWQVWSLEFNK